MKRLVSIFSIALTIAVFGESCEKENEVVVWEEPIADFTLKSLGNSMTFINTSTNWESCIWYFGNGDSTVGVTSPTHVYDSAGLYSVTLVVRNAHMVDETTKIITIAETVIPAVMLSKDPTWGGQRIEVNGLTYDGTELSGDFYLELAYDEDFTQPAKAIFLPKALPGKKKFEFEINVNNEPSGELNGLKPETQYFLRGRYHLDTFPTYTAPVSFTTLSLDPIEFDALINPLANTVNVVTTRFSDINNLLSENFSFFSDPERTKSITPWNWDRDAQSFLPHLGEAVYITYTITYDYHDEVLYELYDEIKFPYMFASGSDKTKKYNIEKYGKQFKIEVNSEHLEPGALKKIVFNCVEGTNKNSAFAIKGNEANDEKNYMQVTYLRSKYYPIAEKTYSLVESDFTKGKNLGFRYFSMNEKIVECRIVDGQTLYLMARPLIRIDD